MKSVLQYFFFVCLALQCCNFLWKMRKVFNGYNDKGDKIGAIIVCVSGLLMYTGIMYFYLI